MGGARFSFYPCVIGVSFLYYLGSSSMVMLGFLLVLQSLAAVWWICRLARSKSISISKRPGIWCGCKSDPFRALDGQKPSEKRCLQRSGGKAVRHPHRTVLPWFGSWLDFWFCCWFRHVLEHPWWLYRSFSASTSWFGSLFPGCKLNWDCVFTAWAVCNEGRLWWPGWGARILIKRLWLLSHSAAF